MQNDPVNLFDPWGLVSAGQLGIGNPGSYGDENTCESMYDERGLFSIVDIRYKDFSDVEVQYGEIPLGPGRWVSPSGGRQIINGVEYTIHALERMAPRGLIQKGTEIMSRGVPPSVVENAIAYGSC